MSLHPSVPLSSALAITSPHAKTLHYHLPIVFISFFIRETNVLPVEICCGDFIYKPLPSSLSPLTFPPLTLACFGRLNLLSPPFSERGYSWVICHLTWVAIHIFGQVYTFTFIVELSHSPISKLTIMIPFVLNKCFSAFKHNSDEINSLR